ncbi:hypothetical protein MBLNU13_g03121t1 [Cladosporium sp. NU13]
MSDIESDSTTLAVDSVTTVGESRGKPSVNQAANGGKRWGPIELHILWDHTHNFDKPSERKCYCTKCKAYWRGENPERRTEYKPCAVWIGRTNGACRIKVCHINHNVEMGAISLEDALAGKRLPLQAPKKALEQAAEEGAISPKRALSEEESIPTRAPKRQKQSAAEKIALSSKAALPEKLRSVQACTARKQTAAEKREISPEDTLTDKPLSSQISKSQKKVAAEKRVRSPKGAFAGKVCPVLTHNPLRKAFAKKRALSTEDTIDDKPLSSQPCKSQEQAPYERRASSPEDEIDEMPPCQQASKSQDHGPAESKARSPEDAPSEKPRPCPAPKPQQQVSAGHPSRFRSADGGRIVSQHTAVERDVANTLLVMHAGTWGQLGIEERSHVLGEHLSDFYIQPNQE